MENRYKKMKNDMNVNPYKTTYGALLKMGNTVEPDLQDFVNRLSSIDYAEYKYDVNYYEMNPIIITGKSEKEKALPPFYYPYLMRANNGEFCILVDVRDYLIPSKVEQKGESLNSYEDLVQVASVNTPAMTCLLSIGKVMAARITGNDNFIKFLWKPLAKFYAGLFIALYDTRIAKLNFMENERVQAAVMSYYYIKSKFGDIDDGEKMINVLGGTVNRDIAAETLNYLMIGEHRVFNCKTLTEVVKGYVDGSKHRITVDTTLFNNSKGEWFGLKGSGLISMMMECDSLFIPILYHALTDRSFNKSKVSILLGHCISRNKNDKNEIIEGLGSNLKPAVL